MQNISKILIRLRKSLVGTFIMIILMIASARLFYYFEDRFFSLVSYKWQGPNDIYFIALALLEALGGLWVIFIYLPRKIGKNDFRNIFAGNFPDELFSYKILSIVGFFAGLSFSGIWKIILIALSLPRIF